MNRKWIALFALGCLSVASQAQTYFNGNKNILVPSSSIAKPGKAHTHYLIYVGPKTRLASANSRSPLSSGPDGYHPVDIHNAYKIADGGGSGAIAIIDAYDNPTILADFNTFSSQFGLPTESSSTSTAGTNKVFQVVYAAGTQPASDADWGGEIALDVEWAHAMAPKAKIYLVEAASSSGADLDAAENVAKQLTGVKECSNSWGSGEYSGETSEDSIFTQPGVVFFASAGDVASERSYPAESPNVVGVGGTSLYMNGSSVTSETAWSDSGGGPSSVEPRPSFQSPVQAIVGAVRGCPDISAIADPNTGVAVFSTFAAGGWFVVGGTSVASPVCAGIANARGSYSVSTTAELARYYSLAYHGTSYVGTNFRDITSGSTGTFNAGSGYDFITGNGVPFGPYFQSGGPDSVSLYWGTYVSGNLSSILATDGNSYTVTSTTANGVSQAAGAVIDFNIGAVTSSTVISLSTTLAMSAPSGATIELYAYNPSSKSYTFIQAFPGQGTIQSYTTSIAPISSYISSSNHLQILLRAITPTRSSIGTISLKIDQAQVSLNSD